MRKISYKIDGDEKSRKEIPGNDFQVPKEKNKSPEARRYRRILSQILAALAKDLILFDLGFAVAFPTIVIPALRRTLKDPIVEEPLYFTDVQASWFGSLSYICQPIGSILSGWVSEPLGRKKAMILVNIPHIIAWILLYYSNSTEMMFVGAAFLGLGVGLAEAPILTYVGEISEPSMRGILVSCAGVASTLGYFVIFLMGSLTDWRTAASICLIIPLTTIVAICFVPETPIWLLSKHRKEDARKSLQWLRGWVSPQGVDKEFNEMQRYYEYSHKCIKCLKANISCDHPYPSLIEKLKEMKRKRTIKAFSLVVVLFAIGQFGGALPMRPFMVQIFTAYHVPIDPSWATVIMGGIAVIGNIICMLVVKSIGKRKICLISLIGSLICCICLGSYAQIVFPSNYNSFQIRTDVDIQTSYFPFVAFLFLSFLANGGIAYTPWMLISEVFSFKTRGLASGIVAALDYIFGFIATITYLNLDKDLSLNGTMWFYSVVNFLGIIYVYFFMPETENFSLEDIDHHFSQNNLKFTDIQIERITSKPDNTMQTDPISTEDGCDNKGYMAN